jgi:hypothetical protein
VKLGKVIAYAICYRLVSVGFTHKKIAQDYNDQINNNRRHYPRLINKTRFELIYRKLIIFCLDIAMAKCNSTTRNARAGR